MNRLHLPRSTLDDAAIEHLQIDENLAAVFFATARCACFKQAARSLSIPVLGLRKRLEQLEEQLGAPLFVYKNNRLALTRAGQRLAHHLQASFGADVQGKPGADPAQPLRIGIPDPLLSDIACRELIAYVREHAEVRLAIQGNCDARALASGVLDIAVSLGAGQELAGYETERLGGLGWSVFIASRYARSVVLPTDHRELADFMLVAAEHERSPCSGLLARHRGGVTRVQGHGLVRAMVLGGACVGVLPSYSREMHGDILALPGFIDASQREDIHLYCRSQLADNSPAAQVIKLVRKAFAERQAWLA